MSEEDIIARSVALENTYVHDVYDKMSSIKYGVQPRKEQRQLENADIPWPKITAFMNQLEPGSIVCDVGCGIGKYLKVNSGVYKIGVDKCQNFVQIAKDDNNEVLLCDNLRLPFRDDSFDAVLSVSVIHHFASKERRICALRELARVLRIGGRLIITVWAMEQKYRKFETQDVLVPWHHPQHYRRRGEEFESALNTTVTSIPRMYSEDANEGVGMHGENNRKKLKKYFGKRMSSSRVTNLTYDDNDNGNKVALTAGTYDEACQQLKMEEDSSESQCSNRINMCPSKSYDFNESSDNSIGRTRLFHSLRSACTSPSNSNLSSPNETCYSFVRKALQKFSTRRNNNGNVKKHKHKSRAWLLESWASFVTDDHLPVARYDPEGCEKELEDNLKKGKEGTSRVSSTDSSTSLLALVFGQTHSNGDRHSDDAKRDEDEEDLRNADDDYDYDEDICGIPIEIRRMEIMPDESDEQSGERAGEKSSNAAVLSKQESITLGRPNEDETGTNSFKKLETFENGDEKNGVTNKDLSNRWSDGFQNDALEEKLQATCEQVFNENEESKAISPEISDVVASILKPKLVKQKKSMYEEDSEEETRDKATDMTNLVKDSSISKTGMLGADADRHRECENDGAFGDDGDINVGVGSNVLKQQSLTEEIMSEPADRLREKERVRQNIQKQSSLNEQLMYAFRRERTSLDSLKDALFPTSTKRKLQTLRNDLANKIKNTSLEKVAASSSSIKNGFIKIFQGLTSGDNSPSWYNKGTVPESETTSVTTTETDGEGDAIAADAAVSKSNISEKCASADVNTRVLHSETTSKLQKCGSEECGDSDFNERRFSHEEHSDSSSKDNSFQSDTSVDSEDSIVSVIFIPKPSPLSPALSPPMLNSPKFSIGAAAAHNHHNRHHHHLTGSGSSHPSSPKLSHIMQYAGTKSAFSSLPASPHLLMMSPIMKQTFKIPSVAQQSIINGDDVEVPRDKPSPSPTSCANTNGSDGEKNDREDVHLEMQKENITYIKLSPIVSIRKKFIEEIGGVSKNDDGSEKGANAMILSRKLLEIFRANNSVEGDDVKKARGEDESTDGDTDENSEDDEDLGGGVCEGGDKQKSGNESVAKKKISRVPEGRKIFPYVSPMSLQTLRLPSFELYNPEKDDNSDSESTNGSSNSTTNSFGSVVSVKLDDEGNNEDDLGEILMAEPGKECEHEPRINKDEEESLISPAADAMQASASSPIQSTEICHDREEIKGEEESSMEDSAVPALEEAKSDQAISLQLIDSPVIPDVHHPGKNPEDDVKRNGADSGALTDWPETENNAPANSDVETNALEYSSVRGHHQRASCASEASSLQPGDSIESTDTTTGDSSERTGTSSSVSDFSRQITQSTASLTSWSECSKDIQFADRRTARCDGRSSSEETNPIQHDAFAKLGNNTGAAATSMKGLSGPGAHYVGGNSQFAKVCVNQDSAARSVSTGMNSRKKSATETTSSGGDDVGEEIGSSRKTKIQKGRRNGDDAYASHDSLSSAEDGGGSIIFHRYYHVFKQGELEKLIEESVGNLHIISSYYDHSNWCIIAEKVHTWKI